MLHSKPEQKFLVHIQTRLVTTFVFLALVFCVFCCVVVTRVCSAARDRHQTTGAVTKSLAVISSFSPFVSPLGFGRRSLSLRPCFTLWLRGSPLTEARLPALCQRRKLARTPHNRPEILFLTFWHERRQEAEGIKVVQLCSAPACIFNYTFFFKSSMPPRCEIWFLRADSEHVVAKDFTSTHRAPGNICSPMIP